MKKMFSWILVLAMFLSLSLVGGWSGQALADTPEDRVGTYTLEKVVIDGVDYTDKLTEIIRNNDVKSVTIVRMEVPCCGGLQRAAENALRSSGKFIPWQVVTISLDGKILDA